MPEFINPSPEEIRRLLEATQVIAVVGLSDKPYRASYRVAAYLRGQGFRVIPVNPTIAEVFGEKAYPNLLDLQEKIDLVDVFRRSAMVPAIVDDAIAIGARSLWLQEDVIHPAAARKAQQAGLQVVMDRCLMVDHATFAAS